MGPGAARRAGRGELRTYRIGRLKERPINNALLVGARLYRTRLDLFDRWYDQHGQDVGRSVAALGKLWPVQKATAPTPGSHER